MSTETEAPKIDIDIASLIPELTEDIREAMRRRMQESFSYQVHSRVQEATKKYIEEAIIPDVMKELKTHEDVLKATFLAAIKTACDACAANIVEHTKKKLAGYEGEEMTRSVMRVVLGR